jgi:hypothetical protein
MRLPLYKGLYHSAGIAYDFEGEGVGIKMTNLEKAAFSGEDLVIIDKNIEYRIDYAYKVYNWVKEHQSYKQVRWNVILGICPISLFEKVINTPEVKDEKIEISTLEILKLF